MLYCKMYFGLCVCATVHILVWVHSEVYVHKDGYSAVGRSLLPSAGYSVIEWEFNVAAVICLCLCNWYRLYGPNSTTHFLYSLCFAAACFSQHTYINMKSYKLVKRKCNVRRCLPCEDSQKSLFYFFKFAVPTIAQSQHYIYHNQPTHNHSTIYITTNQRTITALYISQPTNAQSQHYIYITTNQRTITALYISQPTNAQSQHYIYITTNQHTITALYISQPTNTQSQHYI